MEALIGALTSAGAGLSQTSKEWRRRLRNVDAPYVLCQTLAEIEEEVSQMADGQPTGAPPQDCQYCSMQFANTLGVLANLKARCGLSHLTVCLGVCWGDASWTQGLSWRMNQETRGWCQDGVHED